MRSGRIFASFSLLALSVVSFGQFIDKQRALDAQKFWDNKDWDWYKANIPFFECPDPELTTTYYYRWELVTKHMTYGSPTSGYSFTEFIDRPFWSGAYGAISCPSGHQLYELRWLKNPQYAQDYAQYWFKTPGAQPRRYGCWLADGIWAANEVHPNAPMMKALLPDLKQNYQGWVDRQFVPEVGLFWQNGHDDGMEFNINSRQTKDILRGANGYRPGFNAYMYADALAVAKTARLSGDAKTAVEFEAKAVALKANVQKLLWDPKRDFYFPMAMQDETDNEGNVVKKGSLTYQSGKYAGSPHGRELHGYIPWQFNMADPGYESAWKFLMDPQYFYAKYGPTTVERNDPMFLLQKSCCWWSGQSWPYASAQTLKAMANLLHNYKQDVVSREDYVRLLQIFSNSHRKGGTPYLAEALDPDTGSFEGHDAYNHSEHYFHSSFNDLVITGLVGLKSRSDDMLEVDPLAPASWDYFALDDLSYRGHQVSILWDRTGTRYGKGIGLKVVVDGKVLANSATLSKLSMRLPALTTKIKRISEGMNFAVNNDGDPFPRLTASHTNARTSLGKLNDGNAWYTMDPPNRWSAEGSKSAQDWVVVDLGTPRTIHSAKLYFLDDGERIVAPTSYKLEFWTGTAWKAVPSQARTPSAPTGRRSNVVRFAPIKASKFRATFVNGKKGEVGLTEFELWGPSVTPYLPAPAAPGNFALNQLRKGFPKASASFSDVYGGVPENSNDGRIVFPATPLNRWTSYGSPNLTDWLEIDFGTAREIGRADIYLYDDRGGVQPPQKMVVQVWDGSAWVDATQTDVSPAQPRGSALNTIRFKSVKTTKARIVFTHTGQSRSGVTEVEFRKG